MTACVVSASIFTIAFVVLLTEKLHLMIDPYAGAAVIFNPEKIWD